MTHTTPNPIRIIREALEHYRARAMHDRVATIMAAEEALACLQSLEQPRMSANVINGYELAMIGSEFGLNGDDPAKFLDRLVRVGVLAPAIEQTTQDGGDNEWEEYTIRMKKDPAWPYHGTNIEFNGALYVRDDLRSPAPDGEPPQGEAMKAAEALFDAVGRCRPTAVPQSVLDAWEAYRKASGGGAS